MLHDLRWVVESIAPAELRRRAAQNPAAAPADVELDLYTTLNELPLASNPVIRDAAPFYLGRLAHPTPGDYWLAISPNSGYEQITAPALNIGGWYDIFQWGTWENFQSMRRRGSDPGRAHQRLIIGPWTHTDFSGSFPDREFGPAASATAIDLSGIQLRWFDRWLRGADNGIDTEPPVMIFVMGIDQWRTETDWPLPDTQHRPYYLHSGGQANSLRGDGTLTTMSPSDERRAGSARRSRASWR